MLPPDGAGTEQGNGGDGRWLMPFIVTVCLLGALAIALISAFSR